MMEPAAFLGQLGGAIGGDEEPPRDMQQGPGMTHGPGGMKPHGTGGADHGH